MKITCLQRIMGHENIAGAQGYINQARGQLRQDYAERGPVDRFVK